MLTRYTELVIEYIFFRLANAADPPVEVEKALSLGRGVTFGFLRQESQSLSIRIEKNANLQAWPAYLAKRLRKDMQTGHRLLRITRDRNDLAHGRAARSSEDIEEDLVRLIDQAGWEETRKEFGNPGETGLTPWIEAAPMDAMEGEEETCYGILERYTQRHYEYLIPETGQTFHLPRPRFRC